jgi:hypothetical protein
MEHIQMMISVHYKNISALTPDTSLPLSQAIFLSLSLFLSLLLLLSVVLITQPLSAAAVVAFWLLPSVCTTYKIKFPTVEIHKCIFGSQDTSKNIAAKLDPI